MHDSIAVFELLQVRLLADVDFNPDLNNVTTVIGDDCLMPFMVAVLPISAWIVYGRIPLTASADIYTRPPVEAVTTPDRSIKHADVGKLRPRGFTLVPSLSANVIMLQFINASEFTIAPEVTFKFIANKVSDNTFPFGINSTLEGVAVIFNKPPWMFFVTVHAALAEAPIMVS